MVRLGKRLPVWLGVTAAFMVFVDSTIVNVALPQLQVDLGASRSELEWVINAYTLTFAAMMLGAGAAADAIGAKRVFLLGLTVFTVTSLGCALSGTAMALNLWRLFQGAGAALMLPSALSLATRNVSDERERHRVVGLWAAAGGIGLAAGPLLGGLLVRAAGWPSVFWINVVVGVAAVAVGAAALPATAGHERRLDVAGQTAATAAIAGLVFALIEAPVRGWSDPAVLAAVGIMVLGVAGFVVAERRTESPLLPAGVYRDRTFLGSGAQGALFNFAFYGLLFALSLLLQQQRGLDALGAGLSFLPLTGMVAVGNLSAPRLAARIGRPRVLLAGQVLLTLSLAAVAFTGGLAVSWPLLLALAPAGFSSGLLVPTMTSQTLTTVETALHGAASAAFNTSRQLGAAVGVATFGPLLGIGLGLRDGFTVCILLAAAGTVVAGVLTVLTQLPSRSGDAPSAASPQDQSPQDLSPKSLEPGRVVG
ncbi:MAG: transporter, family, methylenomycin resistance protein [Actinomycetota bacterium]|nr:transporter, family, methylenomycin resistance protein [Actinomycetota bacterium]